MLCKIIKMDVCTSKHHFYVLYEIQKDLEDASEEIFFTTICRHIFSLEIPSHSVDSFLQKSVHCVVYTSVHQSIISRYLGDILFAYITVSLHLLMLATGEQNVEREEILSSENMRNTQVSCLTGLLSLSSFNSWFI